VANSDWYPFENNATLGLPGSEQGIILRDEEHALGARITLERDTHIAPLAITCGIYGHMMHTRFFGSEDEASTQYEEMKSALAALLEAAQKTAEVDGGRQILLEGVSKFVETFP
jgi:hypothetical protein